MRTRPALKVTTAVFGGIALIASLVTLVMIAARMRRGIDWTDDAFYLSLPARFVMGDRPFVDELNVAENAGLFLYPFLKVWHALFGWTGVFLFGRALYVTFFIGVGGAMYALARSCRLAPAVGLLLGAACLCFIPYGLPGLSYNTLGAGFCAIGLFIAAKALVDEKEAGPIYRDPFLFAGLALGCSSFAYPTVVLSAAACGLAVLVLAKDRLRSFLVFCGGGVLVAVIFAPLFLRAGGSGMHSLIDYSFGGQPPTAGSFFDKMSTAWTQFQSYNPDLWKHLAYVGVAILAAKRAPFVIGIFLPLLPLLVRIPPAAANAPLDYFACFGIFGPLFAIALEKRRLGLVLCLAVWVPAVASAFAVSVSSGNGARGAGIGMFPGAIVSALLFALWIEEVSRRWTWGFLRPITQLAPIFFLYAVTQYATADGAIYRDSAIPLLTAKMTSGPYKGLYTTKDRKRWLDKFEADIRSHHAGRRTTFYYDFPVGYLYADLPPHLPSTWNFPWAPHRTEIEGRWLREKAAPGEFLFRVGGGFAPTRDNLDIALTSRSHVVLTGEGYQIFEVGAP